MATISQRIRQEAVLSTCDEKSDRADQCRRQRPHQEAGRHARHRRRISRRRSYAQHFVPLEP